jgi:hypothetical protein
MMVQMGVLPRLGADDILLDLETTVPQFPAEQRAPALSLFSYLWALVGSHSFIKIPPTSTRIPKAGSRLTNAVRFKIVMP